MTMIALPLMAALYCLSLLLLALALRDAQTHHALRNAIPCAAGGLALQALIGFTLLHI